MPYVLNTAHDQEVMLKTIGINSLSQLFDVVPERLRLDGPLDLPPALCELELTAHLEELAARNTSAPDACCFLGGGIYDHFVPAVVDAVAARGEFYTSYTPYQPEVSQGNLQAMFEYQTLITQLTGMDVSNASLYDGGSALAEATLMAISASQRHARVVVAGSVHPEYREILATYLANLETRMITVAPRDGMTPIEEVARLVQGETACLVVQNPNFFGCVEQMRELADAAHRAGALLIVSVDPISLGILARPGDYGADIVVAEGQCLGSPMSYGGPSLGIMACRESLVRRMPGRIAGQTVDRRGNRCWVLTLQTREQHIRREKATSNICTNQGLFALRAAVYLALLGPQGLRETAELCLRKSYYLRQQLAALDRFQFPFAAPTFKEFVVRDRLGRVHDLLQQALEAQILAGIPLGRWYPDLEDCLLVAVTEKRTRDQIDRLAACLRGASPSREETRA